jgi:outer membrane protein TolC
MSVPVSMKITKSMLLLIAGWLFLPAITMAQAASGNTSNSLTLEQCVEYALVNKPSVKQSQINEAIGEREINATMAGWLPQISAQYNVSHNFLLQTAAFGDNLIQIGRKNNSNILLQAEQTLYNNDIFTASRAARFTRQQLDLNTLNAKINTVVEVSKAYYNILLTQEQLRIIDETIQRQEKQYKDAVSQYESGIVDKTDYQRASIALRNSRSNRVAAQTSVDVKFAYLKELMGYPLDSSFELSFDRTSMDQGIVMDTSQQLDYLSRVEIQGLQTQKHILQLNENSFRWGFLPTVSAYANYNLLYLHDEFSQLYNNSYPTSAIGLRVAVPIFQGTRRLQNLRRAQLQVERMDVEMENARKVINTEYQTALANYKSSYTDWLALKENVDVAREVYNTIKLQYDEGIKTYLEVIVAETDLNTAQINYYNALYRVLSSKLDYQRALGTIDIK